MFANKTIKIYKDIHKKADENKTIDMIKKVDNSIIETTSSGSSIVYISRDNDNIFQLFLSSQVSDRIAEMMLKLKKNGDVVYKMLVQKRSGPRVDVFLKRDLIYSPFEYIVPFDYYIIEDDVIAWKKITPLNSIKKLMSKDFLQTNAVKICYDISKGLYALKTINMIHNDCVLDNIGIYKYNFVLFDFDGSGTPEEKGKDFTHDFQTLTKSFSNQGINLPFKFTGIMSIVEFVSKSSEISLEEAVNELERLRIILN